MYNESTGQLTGFKLIEATWADGSPLCTTFIHSRIVKTEYSDVLEREPFKPPSTLIGIPMALPTDISLWTGKFSCQWTIFDMILELNNDQGRRLSGKFSYRKSDMSDSAVSFFLTGTHNPNTGRLSMGPDGWANIISPEEWRQMYFIDGHHLSSPRRLSVRIITGNGPCVDGEIVILRPLQ